MWDALLRSEGQCAPGWAWSWWENLLWWWRFVPNEPVHEQVWTSQLRLLMRGRLRRREARRRWRDGLPKRGRWEWIWAPEWRQNSDLRIPPSGIGSLPSSCSQKFERLSVLSCHFMLTVSPERYDYSDAGRMMILMDVFGCKSLLRREACTVLCIDIREIAHPVVYYTAHSSWWATNLKHHKMQ